MRIVLLVDTKKLRAIFCSLNYNKLSANIQKLLYFRGAVKYYFFVLCLLLTYFSTAQNGLKFNTVFNEAGINFQAANFKIPNQVKDTIEAFATAKKILQKIQSKGFVAASLDTFFYDEKNYTAIFFIGNEFENIQLKSAIEESTLLSNTKLKQRKVSNLYTAKELENIQQKVLSNAENKGYPFAEVFLDSFMINPPAAIIKIDKHELFLFDTLSISEKVKVRKKFLGAYLGIKRNKPYDESKVKMIEQRLNALPFVEITHPHHVFFDKDKAKIELNIKDRKASLFNAFLGVLPGGAGQKVLITGEANLNLYGLLGFGEQFVLEWNKTMPKTQVLKTKIVVPYLFGLPMGVDLRFELFKRDTSWLDLDRDFGVSYQFAGMNYIKASLKQKTTIVLKVDTTFIKQNQTLPNALDINTNEFALEYYFMNLNYRFNPTRGWQLTTGGSVGAKSIKRNTLINDLMDEQRGETFAYLYDSIGKKTFLFSLWLSLDKFWQIHKRMTILTSLKAKYFYSPLIFENEKYRIGGMNTLRGFTEEAIISPYYGIANIEYRYLLSKNAFFFVFFNAAVVQQNIALKQDFPFGFGTGVSLETKVGIFGLTYALGQKHDEHLSFKNSKIHFGYTNYF